MRYKTCNTFSSIHGAWCPWCLVLTSSQGSALFELKCGGFRFRHCSPWNCKHTSKPIHHGVMLSNYHWNKYEKKFVMRLCSANQFLFQQVHRPDWFCPQCSAQSVVGDAGIMWFGKSIPLRCNPWRHERFIMQHKTCVDHQNQGKELQHEF